MKKAMVLIVLIILLATPLTARADYTSWCSPLNGVSHETSLTLSFTLPGTGLHVVTNSPGDYQWVTIPLTLPSNMTIEAVEFCYELANPNSYISQVRLTRMSTPDFATVIHDDPLDRTDPGPVCTTSFVNSAPIEGTVSLSFRLNFANAGDWVNFGAIGIVLQDVSSAVFEEPEFDNLTELALRPNMPNPFTAETMIAYTLDTNDTVDLQILDVSGRAVRTLFRGEQSMGIYRLIWDGCDDHGVEMPAGTYFYRVKIGDQEGSRGMVLVN
jgi:FlgD Ig-like domain